MRKDQTPLTVRGWRIVRAPKNWLPGWHTRVWLAVNSSGQPITVPKSTRAGAVAAALNLALGTRNGAFRANLCRLEYRARPVHARVIARERLRSGDMIEDVLSAHPLVRVEAVHPGGRQVLTRNGARQVPPILWAVSGR